MNKGSGRRILSEKELADFLEHLDESDIEGMSGDSSDSSDLEDEVSVQQEHIDSGTEESEESDSEPQASSSTLPPVNVEASTSGTTAKVTHKNVLWKKRNLVLDQESLDFKGCSVLPDSVTQLKTPYDFFHHFIDDDCVSFICEQTNLYCTQKNPNNTMIYNEMDIKQFIGILQYMSVISLPRTRCYWRPDIGISEISNSMPINKFEALKSTLHFNDNNLMLDRGHPQHDKLFKLRPIIDKLNNKFSAVPREPRMAVDEQICATKARHHLKQYLPLKPNKWGFKLFVLCGATGFAYNFEIYSGPSNYFTKRNDDEPELGPSANVVVRLSRVIDKFQNAKLYCDNYYMSLPLAVHMAKQGIYMLGTVRRNRIPNCKLMDDAKLKKLPRGTSEEFTATVDGVDVCNVIWKDNKQVTLLSTCSGELPITKVVRYDRKRKEMIEIDCPNIIKEYNQHMGGVDLLDSHIARHRILLRSKKWYFRIFCHLMDVTSVNAWLLYRRANSQTGATTKMTLWEFRAEVAQCLCKMGTSQNKRRGRPSDIDRMIEVKRHRGRTAVVPPTNIRTDQIGHWMVHGDARQRCKLPGCKGLSSYLCTKCKVNFCFTKNKNCFLKFHQ